MYPNLTYAHVHLCRLLARAIDLADRVRDDLGPHYNVSVRARVSQVFHRASC